VRLRLLSLIAAHEGGEACVCDLNDAFDLSQPTISHHLKVLHEVGLLDRDKRGSGSTTGAQGGPGRPRHPDRRRPVSTPREDLAAKVAAEFVGTAFLVATPSSAPGIATNSDPTTSASSCSRTA
jgi:DNA-binding transcriptional ArsR family regulator